MKLLLALSALAVAKPELLGDLLYLPASQLTPTGFTISNILSGIATPQDTTSHYTSLPAASSTACAADTCCIWKHVSNDLAASMRAPNGECNHLARGAIRLGFHDAAAWSRGSTGGADGSIILSDECEARRDNTGLQSTCVTMRGYYAKYASFGISAADLIQFAAAVATKACPMGPRARVFVGRKDGALPNPTGKLPSPFASAETVISLFEEKTISPAGLVALLGAHSVSRQRNVVLAQAGAGQDTTPGTWDTNYYREMLQLQPQSGVVRFPSDVAVSQDQRTRGTWFMYADSNSNERWNNVSDSMRGRQVLIWHVRTTPQSTSGLVSSALTTSTT